MKTSPFKVFVLFVCVLIITSHTILSQCLEKDQKINPSKKNSNSTNMMQFNINNIATWIHNDGKTDYYMNSGFEFPKGSGKHAIYFSGLLWGALVNDSPRVGGTYYNTGLQPGRILPDGTAENPDQENVRVFRVRPDYKTSSFDSEINQGEGTFEEIYARYEKDWNQWPGTYGAPYKDVNQNGIYEPQIDIPGIIDADQTLWFVANDLDKFKTDGLAGSQPLNLEIQVSVWGYNDGDYKNNVVFKKYRLINKSSRQLPEMYLNFFSDIDLGNAGDDLCGSVPSLNLGYVYNGMDEDDEYGSIIPAVGTVILQGPIIEESQTHQAIFNGQMIDGKHNLPMTAFFHFYCGGPNFFCPQIGDYENGTLSWYNYFQGIEGLTGHPFLIPDIFGGGTTMYTMSGDPIAETGWRDGIERNAGDRYINLTSGPFNMAPNEIQEIVIAQVIGVGTDRLESINVLKNFTTSLLNEYRNNLYTSTVITDVKEEELPNSFILHQNYPNPFNPSTTITYKISTPPLAPPFSKGRDMGGVVTLKVYDILGREVVTLVNEYQLPGSYSVQLSAEKLRLTSGVYFYTLSAGGYLKTKKMILLK